MATVETTSVPADINPTKKGGKGRKALKKITSNEANISASKRPSSPPPGKDTPIDVLSPSKKKKTKANAKKTPSSELEELQERFQQLQLEKERTEELLKERDLMLTQKEEEIEEKGKEREKLQKEVKKLQKIKEFKPTMTIPLVQSLREEQGKELKKKKRDSQEIKKPSPAYILYCKEHWNEIKKEKPEAVFREISNIVGAKWKSLSAEEKQPYEEKYQEDKEAYLQVVGKEKREKEALKLLEEEQMQKTAMELLEQYIRFKQEAEKETNKVNKKEKDPLKPKQPMSAFFIFSAERRAALRAENKSVLEIAKIAGEEWKKMSPEMRAPYEETARKPKEEYVQQMELYNQKKVEEADNMQKEKDELKKILQQEALQLLKKKEKTENIIKKSKEENLQKKKKQKLEKNSDPNKPKKPASSFLLFSKETRKSLQQEKPDVPNSTINALISVKWKELSDSEKQHWNDKASVAMVEYKKEMEEYNKTIAAQEDKTSKQ